MIITLKNVTMGYRKTSQGMLVPDRYDYARWSKAELNQLGYKLAFIDTNVLSRLLNNTTINLTEKVELFKIYNIKPVFSLELFAEFLQGLVTSSDYKEHARVKQETIEFLNVLKPLWILGHQYISALEYAHLCQHIDPFKDFKVFSDVALEGHGSNGQVPIFECDKHFRNKFIPYEASYKHKGDWQKLLSEFQLDLQEIAQEFKNGCVANFKATLAKSEEFKILNTFDQKSEIYRINENHVDNILKKNTTLSNQDISNANTELGNLTNQSSILQHAPFHTIYDDIYKQHLSGKIKKENDIIDGLFASLSLSYCDYIITNDKKSGLQDLCKNLVSKYNLSVQVLKFAPDTFHFEPA